jgi:hypothetical protein
MSAGSAGGMGDGMERWGDSGQDRDPVGGSGKQQPHVRARTMNGRHLNWLIEGDERGMSAGATGGMGDGVERRWAPGQDRDAVEASGGDAGAMAGMAGKTPETASIQATVREIVSSVLQTSGKLKFPVARGHGSRPLEFLERQSRYARELAQDAGAISGLVVAFQTAAQHVHGEAMAAAAMGTTPDERRVAEDHARVVTQMLHVAAEYGAVAVKFVVDCERHGTVRAECLADRCSGDGSMDSALPGRAMRKMKSSARKVEKCVWRLAEVFEMARALGVPGFGLGEEASVWAFRLMVITLVVVYRIPGVSFSKRVSKGASKRASKTASGRRGNVRKTAAPAVPSAPVPQTEEETGLEGSCSVPDDATGSSGICPEPVTMERDAHEESIEVNASAADTSVAVPVTMPPQTGEGACLEGSCSVPDDATESSGTCPEPVTMERDAPEDPVEAKASAADTSGHDAHDNPGDPAGVDDDVDRVPGHARNRPRSGWMFPVRGHGTLKPAIVALLLVLACCAIAVHLMADAPTLRTELPFQATASRTMDDPAWETMPGHPSRDPSASSSANDVQASPVDRDGQALAATQAPGDADAFAAPWTSALQEGTQYPLIPGEDAYMHTLGGIGSAERDLRLALAPIDGWCASHDDPGLCGVVADLDVALKGFDAGAQSLVDAIVERLRMLEPQRRSGMPTGLGTSDPLDAEDHS